jgi:hypothetical protein
MAVLHDLNLAAALADDMVLLARTPGGGGGLGDRRTADDLLSAAYGCAVRTNQTPQGKRPFVLPPAAFGASDAPEVGTAANGRHTHVCGKLGRISNRIYIERNSNVG